MMKAAEIPIITSKIIESPEMRVKIHIVYSKVKPGLTVRLPILDSLLSASLNSDDSVLDQDEDRQAVNGYENKPLQPKSLALVHLQLRPDI